MRPHPAPLAEAIPPISLATTSILQSFGWKFATDFEMEGEKKAQTGKNMAALPVQMLAYHQHIHNEKSGRTTEL